jgi:hypothetical protein
MFARAVLGSWWAILLVFAVLGGHLWWAVARCEGSYFQRGGEALIILGIIVASQPYWRQRFNDLVQRQNPIHMNGFVTSVNDDIELCNRREAAMTEAAKEVLEERYIGIIIIILGTAINGYGDLVLRWLGLVA